MVGVGSLAQWVVAAVSEQRRRSKSVLSLGQGESETVSDDDEIVGDPEPAVAAAADRAAPPSALTARDRHDLVEVALDHTRIGQGAGQIVMHVTECCSSR